MIRCVVVDDEPIAIRVLETHLSNVPDVEVMASSTNPVEALAVVKNRDIDLVFLDIQMPALSGVGFIESLANPPASSSRPPIATTPFAALSSMPSTTSSSRSACLASSAPSINTAFWPRLRERQRHPSSSSTS